MAQAMEVEAQQQYVTLGVDEETFAVNVMNVREILDYRPVVRIPNSPAYLLGMIDVRGKTIPVIDLRVKLGLPGRAPTDRSRVLVLDVKLKEGLLLIALVADTVHDVISLADGEVEAAPEFGERWDNRFIRGVGRRKESIFIILEIGALFASRETDILARVRPADGEA